MDEKYRDRTSKDSHHYNFRIFDALIIGGYCSAGTQSAGASRAENILIKLSERIPSKPTFSRILNMIDGEKVGVVILEIMRENFELLVFFPIFKNFMLHYSARNILIHCTDTWKVEFLCV
ncbi:hypothetical protein FACS1894187_21390 [Synergistales bacterium]|nr:hypothetical protein FACS1894187_21390 [Synergistales bacterium]